MALTKFEMTTNHDLNRVARNSDKLSMLTAELQNVRRDNSLKTYLTRLQTR